MEILTILVSSLLIVLTFIIWIDRERFKKNFFIQNIYIALIYAFASFTWLDLLF
ncbi:MAG: hypothetical protein ACFBSE_26270 [Prochloraceae cyanobacterium]